MKKAKLTYKHFAEALKDLAGKPLPSLMMAYRASSYLKVKLEEWLIKQASDGVLVEKRPADTLSKADFDDIAFQDSIFDPESYYIIRNTEKKADIAQLLKGIQDSNSIRNKILFVGKYNSVPAHIQKELKRLDTKFIPCFNPTIYELPRFITSLSQKYKLKIGQAGSQLIIDSVGTDLFKIENELKKLSLIFTDSTQEIAKEDLIKYLDTLKEEHAFKLDQSILQGKIPQAQALLHDLIRRGESHLAILGILTHHCRKALQVLQLSKEGRQLKEISQALGMPFGVVKAFIPYVRNSHPQKFKSALFQCQEADIIFKTSRINSEVILSDILAPLGTE